MKVFVPRQKSPYAAEIRALIADLDLVLVSKSRGNHTVTYFDRMPHKPFAKKLPYVAPSHVVSPYSFSKRNHTYVHKTRYDNAQLSFDWD